MIFFTVLLREITQNETDRNIANFAIFGKSTWERCLFLFCHLTIVYQGFYIWNLKRKYTKVKILLRKRYFCPYDTMVKFHVLSFQKVGKFQNLYWLQYQKLQWNFMMFKFSAVSQIWKKYIQKLNDWDLPLSYFGIRLYTCSYCWNDSGIAESSNKMNFESYWSLKQHKYFNNA